MDVAAAPRTGVRALPRPATAPLAVGALVLLAGALHTLLAWRRPTPGYFPDEYMYAELGRSLAAGGAPLVRGEDGGLLTLLYPLFTAPAWLWDDVELAYRTIQGLNAFAMALAAVPAFLLARRLGVGDRLALAVAALTVALPELLYSSAVLAEPLAYPLALAAALAVVAALERPTLRNQLAVVGLGGLAAATRLQLAAIPLCYLAAAVVVGLRERRLRGLLREQRLAVGAISVALAAGLGLALTGPLGLYGDLGAYSLPLGTVLGGAGVNALVLAYAAGWAIVPAALLGLALALARPRSTGELAFGAYAAAFVPLLLLEAAAFGDAGRVQERYAIYALPLLCCLFALYAARGWPWLRAHALLAAGIATAAAVVPLAGYAAADGAGQSVVLASLTRLQDALGDVGLASLVYALTATALSALVLLSLRAGRGVATEVAVVATLAVAAVSTAAGFAHYQERREAVRAAYLPADPSWVDAAADGPVTLLVAPRSTRGDLHSTLFWNRSVGSLALLRGADRPDAFAAPAAEVDRAGRLDLPAGELVLADGHGSWLSFRDADRVAAAQTKTLWRPRGAPQLAALMTGRYYSGLVAAEGALRAWPAVPGGRLAAAIELELAAPPGAGPLPFAVELPDGTTLRRELAPGEPTLLRIPVCSIGPWKATYAAGGLAIVHGTRVGAVSAEPRLVDDPAACR